MSDIWRPERTLEAKLVLSYDEEDHIFFVPVRKRFVERYISRDPKVAHDGLMGLMVDFRQYNAQNLGLPIPFVAEEDIKILAIKPRKLPNKGQQVLFEGEGR